MSLLNVSPATYQDVFALCVISRGSSDDNRTEFGPGYGLTILLQAKHEVAEEYGVHGTPGAVLVGSDSVVRSPVVMGAPAILQLIEGTARSASQTAVGTPA
jgi:hypothetical protein